MGRVVFIINWEKGMDANFSHPPLSFSLFCLSPPLTCCMFFFSWHFLVQEKKKKNYFLSSFVPPSDVVEIPKLQITASQFFFYFHPSPLFSPFPFHFPCLFSVLFFFSRVVGTINAKEKKIGRSEVPLRTLSL